MPVYVDQRPPDVHFARDPTALRLSASQGPPRTASLTLAVLGTLAQGDTITVVWLGQELIFRGQAGDSQSAFDLPFRRPDTTVAQYADDLRDAFALCPDIARDWRMGRARSGDDRELVVFDARTSAIVDAALETQAAQFDIHGVFNPPTNAPVVTLQIEVIDETQEDLPRPLGRRAAPVPASRRLSFDVDESIDLTPDPPPGGIISGAVRLAQVGGVAMRYHVLAAQQEDASYGAERLTVIRPASEDITTFLAIAGHSPAYARSALAALPAGAELAVMADTAVSQAVLLGQPCVRYVVALRDIPAAPLAINALLYGSSGAAQGYNLPIGTVAMRRGDAFAIPTGFAQLALDAFGAISTEATRYRLSLGFDLSPVTYALGSYALVRECPDFTTYIFVDNQQGGFESVRLHTDQAWSLASEATPVRLARGGARQAGFTEGPRTAEEIVEGSTGHLGRERAQYLAHCLPARAWILSGGDLLPGWCERITDTYFDSRTSPHAFSVGLRFRLAQTTA